MPGAHGRCRTGWLYIRMCGRRRSRPHGQPQQKRPDALVESRTAALEPLEADVEAAATAGELPAESRGVSDLGRCLSDPERKLPAPEPKPERRCRRSDLRADRPVECVVRVGDRLDGAP